MRWAPLCWKSPWRDPNVVGSKLYTWRKSPCKSWRQGHSAAVQAMKQPRAVAVREPTLPVQDR